MILRPCAKNAQLVEYSPETKNDNGNSPFFKGGIFKLLCFSIVILVFRGVYYSLLYFHVLSRRDIAIDVMENSLRIPWQLLCEICSL